ncbi:MAG: DUF6765 family protein [bacterium]
MQKDVHFYMTYAVARRVGVARVEALKLAWADQFTDDLTVATLYGIQTQAQADPSGNWADGQIQRTVLTPFHFVPGDDPKTPWMTTPNGAIANNLINAAGTANDVIRFGIALHALQDSFSHAGFSGWREKANSCFPWYDPISVLPNVGHAEMRVIPDVTNYVWTDPRTGEVIDNRIRTMACARATFDWIVRCLRPQADPGLWHDLHDDLEPLFADTSYDHRKEGLRSMVGAPELHYRQLSEQFTSAYKGEFVRAAAKHLGLAMAEFDRIPRPNQIN